MSSSSDFATTEEAAAILGVTVQHVRRLSERGDLSRVARGLVDRASIDRYLATSRGRRTRVWAEHTAWGAIALLSGVRASWLGTTQLSRLRRVLKEQSSAEELVARTRERAVVRTFDGHSAAVTRLRDEMVVVAHERLGLVREVAEGSRVDGYRAAGGLDTAVRLLGLQEAATGNITVRATGFDLDVVRALASSETPVLAALDAASSLDPRTQGAGLRALELALTEYRG
jgi:hypothetical protein